MRLSRGNFAAWKLPRCERHGFTTRTKGKTSFNGLKKVSFTAARMLSRCRGALAAVARPPARSSAPPSIQACCHLRPLDSVVHRWVLFLLEVIGQQVGGFLTLLFKSEPEFLRRGNTAQLCLFEMQTVGKWGFSRGALHVGSRRIRYLGLRCSRWAD